MEELHTHIRAGITCTAHQKTDSIPEKQTKHTMEWFQNSISKKDPQVYQRLKQRTSFTQLNILGKGRNRRGSTRRDPQTSLALEPYQLAHDHHTKTGKSSANRVSNPEREQEKA
ncbi:hypothetical protein YC2023_100476 [Brassica napus]